MWSNLSMRICKTFAKQPFKLVGKKFCPSNLVRPCSYYEDLDLVPEEISAGAKGFATAARLPSNNVLIQSFSDKSMVLKCYKPRLFPLLIRRGASDEITQY